MAKGTVNASEVAGVSVKVVVAGTEEVERLRKKLAELEKDVGKSSKSAEKTSSAFSKLTKSIGRIAFYRAIRTAIREITQGAVEGLQNLRSADEELDNSLNKLSLSATSLKNSFASILSPVIQSIEPVITKISDAIARFVNRANEAKAAMKGESTYTKILTSDTEEYRKALEKTNGALLKFDTFTLQSRDKKVSYTGVVEADVTMSKDDAEDIVRRLETAKNILIGIGVAVAAIGISKLIVDIPTLATRIKNIISPIKGVLAPILLIAAGTGVLVSGLNDVEKAFEKGGTAWEKAAAIFKTVAGAAMVLLGVMIMLKATKNAKTIVGAIAGVAVAGALIAGIVASTKNAGNQVKSYSNGGSFQTADMFYANENGKTELIASSNTGGGAVMNMEQLQSAIYSGMKLAMADGGSTQVSLVIDKTQLGKVVANSPGFISETNRRNSNLNLR